MSRKIAAIVAVSGGTALAMLAGPRGPLGGLWRPVPMGPPTSGEATTLLVSNIIEAIGFGAAIAVLLVGRPIISKLARTAKRTTCAWLATVWLLGSWWPHTALHQHFGLRLSALAPTELVFHAGSIIVSVVLLWSVLPGITERDAAPRDDERHTYP